MLRKDYRTPDQCGVYVIRNKTDGRVYVGSTNCFVRRWACHRSELTRGIHRNEYLQRSWKKYGAANFEFVPLLLCAREDLSVKESAEIKRLRATDRAFGYNLESFTGGVRVKSDETIRKLKAALIGQKRTDETRARIAASKKGKALSSEHREAIRAKAVGRIYSEAMRAKHRQHRHSEETKAKIASAHTGMKVSDEARKNMRAAQSGRPPTPQATRDKIRIANTGKKRTKETKERMSAAAKARWARRGVE